MLLTGTWFLLIAILGLLSVAGIGKAILSGHISTFLYYAVAAFVICISIEVILLLQLRSQVTEYKDAWKSIQTPKPDSFIYVALGDSAAQGIGASSIQNSYVQIVANQISAETGRPVTIINLSKSGGKLQDVLNDQLPQLKGLKPDLVTVDIGANNITAGTPEAEMNKDYKLIIKGLSAYPTVFANLPDFMWGKEQRDTKNINRVIEQTSRENNVRLADLHNETMNKMWSYNEFAADGFHPSNAGHKTWAKAFAPGVAERI